MSGNCPLPRQCMVARTTVLPRGRWLSGASGSRSESSSLWLPAPGCHQPGDQRTGCACHSVSRWLGRGRVPRGARLSSSPVGAKRLCPGPDALRFCPSSCPALQPPPPTQCASLSRSRRSTLGSGGVRPRLTYLEYRLVLPPTPHYGIIYTVERVKRWRQFQKSSLHRFIAHEATILCWLSSRCARDASDTGPSSWASGE